MGFFDNAKNVQIYGGQFKDIHGDLYEYRDQSYNHGSFNSGAKVIHGAYNGASTSHTTRLERAPFSRVDFEAIKREAFNRADAVRMPAVPVEQEYVSPRERPNDGFQGGRRHPQSRQPTGQMWNRRSHEPIDYDDDEENNLDSFQSPPPHRGDPFGWARAGTEPPQQPEPSRQLGRVPGGVAHGAYGMPPSSRTAPYYPSPDPTRLGTHSPGYESYSRSPSEDVFEQETRASNQYRGPRKATNPFLRMEQNEARGVRYTRQVGHNPAGTNINSFNYTSTIIENSNNNDAEGYYGEESLDPRILVTERHGRT